MLSLRNMLKQAIIVAYGNPIAIYHGFGYYAKLGTGVIGRAFVINSPGETQR